MSVIPEQQPRTKSPEETINRTSVDYIKFDTEYRTVIRLIQDEARTVWKHFFQQANGGRGASAVCMNVAPGMNECPVEAQYAHLPRDNEERRDNNARKRFIINVLDRTLHTTCPHCNSLTPGKRGAGAGKFCVNCAGDLKGSDFAPLNKIKILEQGPRLFQQFNTLEKLQLEEIEKPITEYDIVITAEGKNRDRVLTASPGPVKPLEKDALLNSETGEEQTLYDLEALAEPTSSEVITLMMQGATYDQIRAVQNGE